MPFTETTKNAAYKRSGGRCECERQHAGTKEASHHGSRCAKTFRRYGEWKAYHIKPENLGGNDSVSNCQVLCHTCYRLTQQCENN